ATASGAATPGAPSGAASACQARAWVRDCRRTGARVALPGMVLRASEDLFCRLDALEQSHKQLQRTVEEQGAELEILKQGAAEYAKVLRRSLVEDASKYVEREAGPRQPGEAWNAYIQRQETERGTAWLQDISIPQACIGLLRRGVDTPFHHGCKAAHQLREYESPVFHETYLAGVPEDSQDPWVDLFTFIQEKGL
ncbi:hypothetical protein PLESTF_001937400, partial [Pleodorina starrii]